jgi:hypothetical protein
LKLCDMSVNQALAIVGLVACVAACHTRENYLTGPERIGEFLTVTAPATLKADGVDTGAIEAKVTERSPGELNAVFTVAGGGVLIGAGVEGPAVTVPFSDDGTARATLRSDAQPKHSTVTVKIGTVTVTRNVEFVAVSSSSIFTVTADPSTIRADGFSRARIDAVLASPGTTAQRAIAFTTTAGTLFGNNTSGARVEVTANEQGIASAFLQSDISARSAVVTVTARDHSQTLTVPFTDASPSDFISIRASNSSADADNDELVRITATVPRDLPTNKRTVTLRTSRGQFTNGQSIFEQAAGVNGEVSIDLKSDVPGVAIVSAAVEGARAETQVRFDVAMPTQINVTLLSATMTSDGTVGVRATLIRSSGRVQSGMFPVYTATTSTAELIGNFTNIEPTNASQVSTATFNVGTTSYRGPITIRVASPDGSVGGTAIVQIREP